VLQCVCCSVSVAEFLHAGDAARPAPPSGLRVAVCVAVCYSVCCIVCFSVCCSICVAVRVLQCVCCSVSVAEFPHLSDVARPVPLVCVLQCVLQCVFQCVLQCVL